MILIKLYRYILLYGLAVQSAFAMSSTMPKYDIFSLKNTIFDITQQIEERSLLLQAEDPFYLVNDTLSFNDKMLDEYRAKSDAIRKLINRNLTAFQAFDDEYEQDRNDFKRHTKIINQLQQNSALGFFTIESQKTINTLVDGNYDFDSCINAFSTLSAELRKKGEKYKNKQAQNVQKEKRDALIDQWFGTDIRNTKLSKFVFTPIRQAIQKSSFDPLNTTEKCEFNTESLYKELDDVSSRLKTFTSFAQKHAHEYDPKNPFWHLEPLFEKKSEVEQHEQILQDLKQIVYTEMPFVKIPTSDFQLHYEHNDALSKQLRASLEKAFPDSPSVKIVHFLLTMPLDLLHNVLIKLFKIVDENITAFQTTWSSQLHFFNTLSLSKNPLATEPLLRAIQDQDNKFKRAYILGMCYALQEDFENTLSNQIKLLHILSNATIDRIIYKDMLTNPKSQSIASNLMEKYKEISEKLAAIKNATVTCFFAALKIAYNENPFWELLKSHAHDYVFMPDYNRLALTFKQKPFMAKNSLPFFETIFDDDDAEKAMSLVTQINNIKHDILCRYSCLYVSYIDNAAAVDAGGLSRDLMVKIEDVFTKKPAQNQVIPSLPQMLTWAGIEKKDLERNFFLEDLNVTEGRIGLMPNATFFGKISNEARDALMQSYEMLGKSLFISILFNLPMNLSLGLPGWFFLDDAVTNLAFLHFDPNYLNKYHEYQDYIKKISPILTSIKKGLCGDNPQDSSQTILDFKRWCKNVYAHNHFDREYFNNHLQNLNNNSSIFQNPMDESVIARNMLTFYSGFDWFKHFNQATIKTEDIINVITYETVGDDDGFQALFKQALEEYLQESEATQNYNVLLNFLASITGSKALTNNIKIRILATDASRSFFISHTCFKRLDVFLKAIKETSEGFNDKTNSEKITYLKSLLKGEFDRDPVRMNIS